MDDTVLFFYLLGLVFSFAMTLLSAGNMIQVLKLDVQLKDNFENRNEKLFWCMLFATLAPIGSAFAFGFTVRAGISGWYGVAPLLVIIMQVIAVVYLVNEVVPAPMRSNVVPLKPDQKSAAG